MVVQCDFIVVGAGIAGASAAYHLSEHGKAVLLEREDAPGYHTTGRSAAVFFDTYGPPPVRQLTAASRGFLTSPPAQFSDQDLLSPCGAMFIARADQLAAVETHLRDVADSGARVERIDAREVIRRVPIVREDYVAAGVYEPEAMNMDVHAIHQGYLRGARRRQAALETSAQVRAIDRQSGQWRVSTRDTAYQAPVVVNAAGAWCDEIAALAGVASVGLVPMRRTAIHVAAPNAMDISSWPLLIDIEEQFYFKPDAGKLLCSPADETPIAPCDVQPEELDVAVVVDRLERATTLSIARVEKRWAGLRSFVSDHSLVIGEEGAQAGFFWMAGQGGYGIQTSPAAGQALASLVTQGELPANLTALGLSREVLAPERLR